MLILAVDTTTRFGSVALLEDTDLLVEINYTSLSSHSRQLFRAVDEVFRISDRKLEQVEGLAVAAGPGSFTGIRIGLSLVKALSLASGKPVAPVSSLPALALKMIFPGAELIAPVIDARKGEIFAALYRLKENGQLEELLPEGAYLPEDFLLKLPAAGKVEFLGTGSELYRELLTTRLGSRARFSRRSYYLAAEVGRIGYEILKSGGGQTSSALEPIYYRKSQAEEKKAGRQEK
ncbi:MAG: tRNA (adenosine(37)-N6)-threonylcarbamoyltransferase complex dimerization subunit type 1 TsaB [Candidatus Aminicenantes bacterium]|nr:tRNA (adenosine(37)-N6)-threonylcarbamoyltransferase complex dimerization subunit type 1 TsaB [Candidatus Aminicenantes bacterium]